jgi:hypothetical protein
MKVIITINLAILLSGCAGMNPLTEPWTDTILLPNGQEAVSINCGGILNSYSDCMRKAGEKCPGGYTILDKDYNSSRLAVGTSQLSGSSANGYGPVSGTSNYTSGDIINRIMVIQCANGAKPKFSVF